MADAPRSVIETRFEQVFPTFEAGEIERLDASASCAPQAATSSVVAGQVSGNLLRAAR
jgi:hypothetical protein